ncbi:MAG: SDR family oxidoreductase [Gaiellaceae bacterium]|jgi:NAD(P)-dependent dehydrogenase (short-subunit alcohol dehydrogenase family)
MTEQTARTALVTGAAQGIGRACAERFLAEGWKVIGWDVAPASDSRIAWQTVDISDWDAVAAAGKQIDRLDAAVNCAAIARLTPTLEMSRDDWDRTIAVNLSGAYYVSRHLYPALRAAQGVLVHLGSVSGKNITTNRASYSCAKAGIVALTQVLAVEWALARSGVRVLAVSPGLTLTEQPLQRIKSGAIDEETLLGRVPTHRWVQPEEIASAVFRLVGEDFTALHGSVVFLDAGYDAWGGHF